MVLLQCVLFSQHDVHFLFHMSHIHVDTTSSQVCSSVCALSTPACITPAVTRFTNVTMMLASLNNDLLNDGVYTGNVQQGH